MPVRKENERFLHEVRGRAQELRLPRAINRPVVARQHQRHRLHRLSPSERGITGPDLREPFLHHRRDEPAVVREHSAARDRTAASARRHVLRVEQPLVDAERSMKPHAVAEARLLRFRAIHDTPCG